MATKQIVSLLKYVFEPEHSKPEIRDQTRGCLQPPSSRSIGKTLFWAVIAVMAGILLSRLH